MAGRETTTRETGDGDDTHVRVLDALGDADCRRLLRMLAEHGPMSVRALHEDTGIAQSTLYRKMDSLSATPLVTAETYLAEGGRQPTRYRVVADAVAVELEDPIQISVATEESARRDDATGGTVPDLDENAPSTTGPGR
jgi:DNA-binding transcriptional ArsR family regulator